MKIDRSEEQHQAELLQILITGEPWKVFRQLIAMTRTATLEQLAYEQNEVEMHRLQGMVRAIDTLVNLPEEAIRSARHRSAEEV